MRKNYILDSNVLLHDPHSIFHFVDNTVIIPVAVITEIDKFKKERSDRGANARAVVRLLDGLRSEQNLAEGVPLEHGGQLRVFCEPDRVLASSNGNADLEILRVAREIQRANEETPVVIVTKDINLRIRADALGLKAEDYESDRIPIAEIYTGHAERDVSPAAVESFKETGELPDFDPRGLSPNEYLLLKADNGTRRSALARWDAEHNRVVALKETLEGLCSVKPRNKEQYFAVDALLNDEIRLVTLMGKAGTGKTLLAIAAALHLGVEKRRFRGVVACRPIFPLGRDIGYLPGDLQQKLDPWMKPVADTVEYLLDAGGPLRRWNSVEGLIDTGMLEIQPLTYIRGRSIANRFVVIDEAQNLTPLEVKTVITRIGQDAKIVLTGDPDQIDNPYIDASSNGFTFLIDRFRDQPIAAHIEMRKGERSVLAELAANLL